MPTIPLKTLEEDSNSVYSYYLKEIKGTGQIQQRVTKENRTTVWAYENTLGHKRCRAQY